MTGIVHLKSDDKLAKVLISQCFDAFGKRVPGKAVIQVNTLEPVDINISDLFYELSQAISNTAGL